MPPVLQAVALVWYVSSYLRCKHLAFVLCCCRSQFCVSSCSLVTGCTIMLQMPPDECSVLLLCLSSQGDGGRFVESDTLCRSTRCHGPGESARSLRRETQVTTAQFGVNE